MSQNPPTQPEAVQAAEINRLKNYLIASLTQEFEGRAIAPEDQRRVAGQRLEELYAKLKLDISPTLKQQISRLVLDEVVGYGPIQPFLDDPTVSEIMVNGPKLIFVERQGELFETKASFEDDAHALRTINKMILPLGRRIDRDSPMVDARLPDGSRLNAVIPPVTINGPIITIRKFLLNRMGMDDLMNMGSLTPQTVEFLKACVLARLNILVSGPTSSGKTTFLNLLSGFIPEKERIITIEDAVELQLKQKHVLSLETRPPDSNGNGAVTTRDLVRNTLRMRPDRIIVGEVRSAEALDMLQAMNTGHSGSLATLHANSPRDATSRLETMVLMAGLDLPLIAIRRQIASAINLVVHLNRLSDGTRKVTQITEISGMEGDIITMTDIFKFEQSGLGQDGKVQGQLLATGIRPMFTPKLEVIGFKLKGDIYGAGGKPIRPESGGGPRRG